MNEKRELPILNGKLLSDLDANGHKIIGVDIEFSPEKIKKAIAPELDTKADKSEVDNKAEKDKVWLRGNNATGETNYAHAIKVKVISALYDEETGIIFDAPIVSNTVNYGGENEPAFAVIEGNMIQAFSNDGSSNSDLVFRGRSFYFQGNSYDYPQSPPALYTEGDIFCDGAIVTSEIEDENGHIQNITIKNNEISARFMEDEWGGGYHGKIVMNAALELPNGSIYCPNAPITASSFDSYMYYVSSGGALVFNSYDEWGSPHEFYLNADEVEQLSSNSWYVQENLRGHITHGMVYDDWYGGEVGAVTITPTDEYGGYSDFYFSSNGNLTMSGTFRCYGSEGSGGGVMADWVSCTYDVSCNSVYAAYGVDARSRTDEWGWEYGGVIVRDEYAYDTVSSLLGGILRIGDKNYGDCVEITVVTGDLSLLFYHQDEKLTFSFSDFATLRTMIDEYNASKGA